MKDTPHASGGLCPMSTKQMELPVWYVCVIIFFWHRFMCRNVVYQIFWFWSNLILYAIKFWFISLGSACVSKYSFYIYHQQEISRTFWCIINTLNLNLNLKKNLVWFCWGFFPVNPDITSQPNYPSIADPPMFRPVPEQF